jgi:aminobenzoyl-glutamate utilization protein B
MKDYSKIDSEVTALSDFIWDMATNVWKFAELGYGELKSSAYESTALEKQGFKITDRGIGGMDTAWIATWGSGSPVVGFLVEFDALPGLGNEAVPTQTPRKDGITSGHGCGHNLIGSGSIGAAIALKAQMEKEGIKGTIKVFGCPAEEKLNGKNYMASAGAFKGLDVCLHNHPAMINTVWNFHSTASIDLWVEWFGTTAHAGVSPWDGRSALQAAEVFLVAANMMREHVLPTARMHYQILDGGKAVNVVPDYAKVLFRYRGVSAENVVENVKWIKDIAKGAALATQTKEKVTNLGGIYDCLQNDVFAKRMNDHVNRYLPIEWTDDEQAFAKSIQKEMDKPEDGMATAVLPMPTNVEVGGSSDVGDVSWNVPTMGVVYSSWPQHIAPHQWGCTACHGMSIGRKAVIQAAKVLAATGLDLMTEPDLLKGIRDEFDRRVLGQPYKTLNELAAPVEGTLGHEERSQYECRLHAAMEHFGIKEAVS